MEEPGDAREGMTCAETEAYEASAMTSGYWQ